MPEASSRNKYRHLTLMASFVLVVAAMYWARAVLIPVALAILLAFLLGPPVRALQQRGLKRIPAVILVVTAAFLVLGALLWILTAELTQLGQNFHKYEKILHAKLDGLRASIKGTVLERFLNTGETGAGAPAAPGGKPQPALPRQGFGGGPLTPEAGQVQRVVVVKERPEFYWQLTAALDPVVHLLGTTGLIVLLVILMLIHREELRNRLIRLAGYGRLTVTTRALDEASARISYYLLMKSLVNGCFGVAIGLGLLLIGLPFSFLWGFLVAVLRFIPSLGTWLAMLAPLALSVVAFEAWWPMLYVLGLFAVLELFTTNVIEPLTYGHRIGVSSVALVVALAFWTWLWGPVGLVLATPLTVCLAVLGKYFPQLEFINVLMSDRPALEANIRYYQRLLARDQDEATDVVEHYLTSHPVAEVYDELLLPALTAAREARGRDELSEDDQHYVLAATRDILEDLPVPPAPAAGAGQPPAALVLGYTLREESAALALEMLGQLLRERHCRVELAPPEVLLSELVTRIEEAGPAALCVIALAPGGLALARSLLKRLRGHFPELKIVVARLGPSEDADRDRKVLTTAGADVVAATLLEARDQLTRLAQLPPRPQPDLAASAAGK
jgi:predicted PurR-regulated permease PerM